MNCELFHPLDGFLVLDFLGRFGLSGAGGHKLEGGILSEVLEVLAWEPADVDGQDVVGREVFGEDSTFGLEFGIEAPEVS